MGGAFPEREDEADSHVNWIVCGGMTRDVDAGHVECPQRDQVDLSRCLECPYLETLDREWSRLGCATPGV